MAVTDERLLVNCDSHGRWVSATPLPSLPCFWSTMDETFRESRRQRYWVHKTMHALPKSLQAKARAALHAIWMWRQPWQRNQGFDRFLDPLRRKVSQSGRESVPCREPFWPTMTYRLNIVVHLRTSNLIEVTYATVGHRTTRTKNCVSRSAFLSLAFKVIEKLRKPGAVSAAPYASKGFWRVSASRAVLPSPVMNPNSSASAPNQPVNF